ncbi:MAG: hypothetical protein U5L02_15130 [Rheinheimera sp.]|nr:hypothetical protein [Rheinheimera sp.]
MLDGKIPLLTPLLAHSTLVIILHLRRRGDRPASSAVFCASVRLRDHRATVARSIKAGAPEALLEPPQSTLQGSMAG